MLDVLFIVFITNSDISRREIHENKEYYDLYIILSTVFFTRQCKFIHSENLHSFVCDIKLYNNVLGT